MSKRLPFMKFFPRDWMADDKLRLASLAARGLWIDLLCLMHQAPERGYLTSPAGEPLTAEQIGRATGAHSEAPALLAELEACGVFSRDANGAIYSRRLSAEYRRWNECRKNGQKGGNPALKNQGGITNAVNHPDKELRRSEGQKVRIEEKNPPTPRKAAKGKATPDDPPIPAPLDTPDFRTAWAEWFAARAEMRKPLTERAAKQQLAALAKLPPAQAIECIRASIRNGYQGLFPERFNRGANGNSGASSRIVAEPGRHGTKPVGQSAGITAAEQAAANGSPEHGTKHWAD